MSDDDDQQELPDNKAEAKLKGLPYYLTGTPCSNGHLGKRSVKSGCVECTRERKERQAGGGQPTQGYQTFSKGSTVKNDAFKRHAKNFQRGK